MTKLDTKPGRLEIINFIKIKARDVQVATKKLRKRYPYSKIISYRFEKDYKFVQKEERDYKNRIMEVAFIKNMKKLW